jgi:PhnB protein
MSVHWLPEGYTSVTPYLTITNATQALDFYREAFGAEEVFRLPMGDRLGHAEIRIGGCHIMLADEFPEMQDSKRSPATLGGTSMSLMIYVPDADAAFARAVAAGAKVVRPVEDQFYGDRAGTVQDPFGHIWTFGTHVEDVPPEEIAARMAKMGG